MALPTTSTSLSTGHTTAHDAVYDVKAFYGAAIDGSTDDSTKVNDAITDCNAAGGGIVYIGAGTCMANVTIKPKVRLVGAGINATILKSVASSNADVIKGLNFATLTGKAYASGDYALGAYDCGIENMTIDGNKSLNAGGYGIRIWGKGLRFHNIIVQNCDNDGIFTEFTTHDSGAVDNEPGGHFAHIHTSNNGGNGWTFRGPHDSQIDNLTTWSNTGWGLYSDYSSGSYNGTLGYCKGWNSWLNGNSFYFNQGPSGMDGIAATGSNVGTGIELSATAGAGKFTNAVIAGHTTGLLMRGSNHMFQGLVQQCTTGVELAGSTSASVLMLSLGSTNTTGVTFTSESGGNVLTIAGNIGAGTLFSGTPHISDIVAVSHIAGGNLTKLWLGDVTITKGDASPASLITANPGSLYLRTNHEIANQVLYVKETGYGNTGWVAK